MAAALEIELEIDNEDYYSLLNVRREVRKRIFLKVISVVKLCTE